MASDIGEKALVNARDGVQWKLIIWQIITEFGDFLS